MGKRSRNRKAGKIAMGNRQDILDAQANAQAQYDQDLTDVRGAADVTDFYKGLGFKGINLDELAEYKYDKGDVATMGDRVAADYKGYDATGYADKDLGYTALGTNVGGLARGANTGLTNVFNNLQVSTAGADLAAQEADQSLAASQEAMMMMGGGGGATALAAQAAKSKAGIAAGIDQQVKANEMLRAQGEQGLQRDLLAQGNLASQFDLGQSQFNIGAQNQARQFSQNAQNQAYQFDAAAENQARQFEASAFNQAEQFNAGQANNMTLSQFVAENAMEQFNVNAANNAFTNQANSINNAIAQNQQQEQAFDFAKAGGQAQAESDQYDALMGILEISLGQMNDADRASSENLGTIQQGAMSGGLFSDRNAMKKMKRESGMYGSGGRMSGNVTQAPTSIYGDPIEQNTNNTVTSPPDRSDDRVTGY